MLLHDILRRCGMKAENNRARSRFDLVAQNEEDSTHKKMNRNNVTLYMGAILQHRASKIGASKRSIPLYIVSETPN